MKPQNSKKEGGRRNGKEEENKEERERDLTVYDIQKSATKHI